MRLFGNLLKYAKLPKDYANLPDGYVKRVLDETLTEWKTPKGMQYQNKRVRTVKRVHYEMDRVWSDEFKNNNSVGKTFNKYFVEPLIDWTFLRGDRVEILDGKDKGKQGIVNYIVKERNWVTVEGLNCRYKFLGKTSSFPGTMYKEELPLLVNRQVALIDPADNKPTSVKWRYTEDGDKVRVSTRTGRIIPIPETAFETMDYKNPQHYTEQAKDTKAADVERVTFEPKLMTFEEEIMKEEAIVEERIPFQTFWY